MAFSGSGSKKNEEYWKYLKDNYREVSKWPTWMRGEVESRGHECAGQFDEKKEKPGEEVIDQDVETETES